MFKYHLRTSIGKPSKRRSPSMRIHMIIMRRKNRARYTRHTSPHGDNTSGATSPHVIAHRCSIAQPVPACSCPPSTPHGRMRTAHDHVRPAVSFTHVQQASSDHVRVNRRAAELQHAESELADAQTDAMTHGVMDQCQAMHARVISFVRIQPRP